MRASRADWTKRVSTCLAVLLLLVSCMPLLNPKPEIQFADSVRKAKAEGVYRGRPENAKRNDALLGMLRSKQSWSSIVAATGCSRSTLARLAKRLEEEAPQIA